jgi:CheY-like chemotaxis protein
MSYWSTTPPRRAHILLIDDNIEELQLLLGVLREAGHRISLAFDAMQGYRRVTALQPDLVLLDVRMGGNDGFTTCRLLKADPATARIPVIFVTSSSTVEERLTGLREGAVDYILKPFEPAEVLARVAVHLALSGSQQQARACMAEAESALENAARGERTDRGSGAGARAARAGGARGHARKAAVARVPRTDRAHGVRVRARCAAGRGAAFAGHFGAQRRRSGSGSGFFGCGQFLDGVSRALRVHADGISPGAPVVHRGTVRAAGMTTDLATDVTAGMRRR